MDPPIKSVGQRMLSDFSDLNMVYKIGVAILLAILLQGVLSRLRPQKRHNFPVWAPLEIALTGFIVTEGGLSQRIFSSMRRYGGSLFGLTSKHQVLVNLAGVDRIMSSSQNFTSGPVGYTFATRVFGSADTPELEMTFDRSLRALHISVERLFLNDAAATAAVGRGGLYEKATSFVTFSADPKTMKRWELSANIRLVTPELPGQSGIVEANLQRLARDFGACFAIPLLFGQDFLDRCPQLLDDFWKFDNDMFPLLMIGIPSWAPFKMMQEGKAARSRLTREMEALHRRIDQYQRGVPVDFGADMSDLSTTALERSKIYTRDNKSFKQRGVEDMTLLWGQNANTQPVLFWLLAYVYSTPGLVDELRKEITPYICLNETNPSEITAMDLPALYRDCQFLKACLFETYRLTIEATSLRHVSRPTTVIDGAYKHELKPGMWVSAPHGLIQRDPSVFADPEKFIPDRFLETDPESGKSTARYGRLKPWGCGAAMCKGRTFAEKELLALGAAIISLWDVGPASGTWKLPAMIPGTGVKKPVEDIRVLITRRAS